MLDQGSHVVNEKLSHCFVGYVSSWRLTLEKRSESVYHAVWGILVTGRVVFHFEDEERFGAALVRLA